MIKKNLFPPMHTWWNGLFDNGKFNDPSVSQWENQIRTLNYWSHDSLGELSLRFVNSAITRQRFPLFSLQRIVPKYFLVLFWRRWPPLAMEGAMFMNVLPKTIVMLFWRLWPVSPMEVAMSLNGFFSGDKDHARSTAEREKIFQLVIWARYMLD